jgi:hypothetical protein
MLALIGESFNRMEMVLRCNGSDESKLAVLKEISASQDHIKSASELLVPPRR